MARWRDTSPIRRSATRGARRCIADGTFHRLPARREAFKVVLANSGRTRIDATNEVCP
jgi:hypothetical protein